MSRIQRRQRHAMIDQEALQVKVENWRKEDPTVSIFFRPKSGPVHEEKEAEDSDDDEDEDEEDVEDGDDDELNLEDLFVGNNEVHATSHINLSF